jgi:hypothetical protein
MLSDKRYRKERIRTSSRLPFSATKSFYFRFAKIIGDTPQTFSAKEQKRQWGIMEGLQLRQGIHHLYRLVPPYTQYLSKCLVLSCAKSPRFKFYSIGRYLHSSFIKFKSEEFCFAQRTNKLSEYTKLGKNVRHRDSLCMGRLSANHNWLW